ncbi:MAG: molybdopterin-dependent oxidoreductase, partial [Nitrospirota bacterium]|nr:molybdopterin-dependent oxidoreductase [Nitrospirota bacterium]
MDLKRRTLLKMLGTVAAGSVLPGCDREVHRLVPYLLPDDEIVPGLDTWYASVCRQCEAGCGILVRTREGRAKKIEGNPSHPVSRGKVCARGQAVVQELYHPDRLRGPLRRTGKRGSGQYEPLTWDEAIELWVTHLAEHPGASAMLSRPIPGTLADVFAGFFHSIGGQVLFYEPATELPTRQAERAVFGCAPYYDMAHCDHLLSFGAPFLDHWQSPVACGRAFGAMRQDRPTRRGRFIQLEPRLSLTAASADEWIALRPGTEGLVALGIGQILLELGRPSLPPADAFASVYRRYRLTDVAAQSEVPEATLRRVAHELASAAAPLIIGGGTAASYTNSTSVMTAILGLNRLLGNLGKPGGVRLFKPSGFVHGRETPLGDRAVVDLLKTFETGEARILHLYQTDPVYGLPPSTQCRRLLDHAELIISFSSFLDDTTAMADLILPDHTSLEAWGDVADPPMAPLATVGLAQPVVLPLYDTRAVGDVWL